MLEPCQLTHEKLAFAPESTAIVPPQGYAIGLNVTFEPIVCPDLFIKAKYQSRNQIKNTEVSMSVEALLVFMLHTCCCHKTLNVSCDRVEEASWSS